LGLTREKEKTRKWSQFFVFQEKKKNQTVHVIIRIKKAKLIVSKMLRENINWRWDVDGSINQVPL
jgi:hypothetical protein